MHRKPAAPPSMFSDASRPLAGETLDIDTALADAPEDTEPSEPSPSQPNTASAARASHALAPGSHAARALEGMLKSRVHAGETGSPASAPPALFGAVGVRYAMDLATSFTRGFPQAASADPLWASVPFGAAGAAEVTLVLDDTGHLTSRNIAGSPSPALRQGIERTLALLGARAFTARGAVTHLRVTAHVGRNDVHDGLHGDVFALSGGSFSGDVGSAFFALPPSAGPGRRVDVELRLSP